MAKTPFRVVIAEDEALIRLDLKEMLEEEDYEVVGEAGDGETAVKLAVSQRPDLVILDVKMPVLDGLSAAEQIAEQRIAPVVILTAFSQRDLVERARDAGAMAYLVKPFTKADLVPAIEMAASRFQETRALEDEVTTLRDRLEVRKLLDRAKGLLQDRAWAHRAGGVPLDPEDVDGPQDQHARGRAGGAGPGHDGRHGRCRRPARRPGGQANPPARYADTVHARSAMQ